MAEELSKTPAKEREIAIFGGAFDPFHSGHASAIRHLLNAEQIKRVVVMPSGDRPDKKSISSAEDRLTMARLGVSAYFGSDLRIEVSDLQAHGVIGYATYDVVSYFADKLAVSPLVVIGQELMKDLPNWRDAEKLREKARFLVLVRPGASFDAKAPGWNLTVSRPFGAEGVAISSTELRASLRTGARCPEFIEQSVYDYCCKRQLYLR